jgi:ABC-2 type transport system ATP-binding protein
MRLRPAVRYIWIMSIRVDKVSKLYGAQKALNGISFEVPSGQIAGFLGPNGAGKSTMMKILTAFLPPTSGSVEVAGHRVSEDPIAVKRVVGYLPEHNPLYLEMYVREFLTFMAKIHGKGKRRIEEAIEQTGLASEAHKKIGALSKGYRQRVGLAHALLHEPQVLILDEPTTGLDPNQIVEIRSLIRSIGTDRTVLFSTHIMQEVEQLCDRVIVLNKGTIVADEGIAQLKKRGASLEAVFQQLTSSAG